MPTSEDWESRLLYSFLIGNRDRHKNQIPRESLEDALVDLFEQLKSVLGGITKMRPFEATGDTANWGSEPTTVVLVLATARQEELADSSVAEQARWLTHTLAQEEVWITKQRIELHIAQHSH
jgi:hypothetical protein